MSSKIKLSHKYSEGNCHISLNGPQYHHKRASHNSFCDTGGLAAWYNVPLRGSFMTYRLSCIWRREEWLEALLLELWQKHLLLNKGNARM